MRRLYLHIYLTVLGVLVLFGVLVWLSWLVVPPDPAREKLLEGGAALLAEQLPAIDGAGAETQSALERLGERLGVSLTLRDLDGDLLAATGEPLPAPPPERRDSGWMRGGAHGPTLALRLPDGRWLIARSPQRHPQRWLGALALLAIAIAVGAYPVVRRITRRLERLQARVERLGEGDLGVRVEVEGNDEVAMLARSFNHAAQRIERLVQTQRSILASASHELRSPLARIAMAVELLAKQDRPELRDRIARDIRELDELIDELLVASRVNAGEDPAHEENVDLLALAAEEAARVGARTTGTATVVRGDARSLRRMLRNLLENAQRHGGGAPIEVCVEPLDGAGARITVSDTGPGVPEAERERIFEPFYRPPSSRESVHRGTGLGLALVREIARRHGGGARYLPRAEGGSCFEVTIMEQ